MLASADAQPNCLLPQSRSPASRLLACAPQDRIAGSESSQLAEALAATEAEAEAARGAKEAAAAKRADMAETAKVRRRKRKRRRLAPANLLAAAP